MDRLIVVIDNHGYRPISLIVSPVKGVMVFPYLFLFTAMDTCMRILTQGGTTVPGIISFACKGGVPDVHKICPRTIDKHSLFMGKSTPIL